AVAELRDATADGGHAVELQSLIEQACHFYLATGCFPATYEAMQPLPVLKAGVLPYAGDDGAEMGQAYQLCLCLDQRLITPPCVPLTSRADGRDPGASRSVR